MRKITAFLGSILLVIGLSIPAQEGEQEDPPVFLLPLKASVTEKVTSDLRLYRNGTYIEHVHREIRGRFDGRRGPSVTGRYYILEDVIRNSEQQGKRIDETEKVTLPESARLGEWLVLDEPFPRIRPFPRLEPPLPSPGSIWREDTTMVLYPEHHGEAVTVSAPIRYIYNGTASFYGELYHSVTGHLDFGHREYGEGEITRIEGVHEFTILFYPENLLPYFIRDRVDETYTMRSGEEISCRGFVNHWFSYTLPGEEDRRVTELQKDITDTKLDDVEVLETDEGITLRLKSLRFKPDQAVLLPGEDAKLAEIAGVLKRAGEGTAAVIGHTADVGNPEGQKELSLRRAETVVEKLIEQGVDPDRLLFEGRGAAEPIAGNDTEEGRAANRRVEIILLD
ncbi:MAG: OmpA family protein [Spirochaetia bacterium]